MLSSCETSANKSLAAVLAIDPALTLWCVIRSQATTPLPSVDALAKWLTAALPACLAVDDCASCPTDEADTPRTFDAEELLDWATTSTQMALQSVQAHGDTDLSERLTDLTDQPAYTHGLLHNAVRWAGEEHAVALVARLGLIPDDVATDQLTNDVPLRQEIESQVTDHWTHTSQFADHAFSLAAKLSHTAAIESDFAAQLQQEKLQAMYTLAAGAGHEINNPLGSIAGRAQLLIRDEADPQRRRTLAKINAQAFRAHEMIADMMLFARPPQPVRADVDMATLAAEVVEELRDTATERSTVMTFHPPSDPVHLSADRSQIAVALRAMCINSLEALGSGGHVEITTRNVEANGHGSSVQIDVRDDGPGIDPQLQSQLFDPFYSGREAGRGLGFGLSKCWRIVTNHGGEIHVDSQPGRGATFTMILPVQVDRTESESIGSVPDKSD